MMPDEAIIPSFRGRKHVENGNWRCHGLMMDVFPCRFAGASLHSAASRFGQRAGWCYAGRGCVADFRFGPDAGVLVTGWP